jgi:nucleotide-binding universal stress UspA family protein
MSTTLQGSGPRAPSEATVRIKRILVPFDFGEQAEHALSFAQKLAPTFGASVEALYVVPFVPNNALTVTELGAIPLAEPPLEEVVREAEGRLHEVLASEDERHRYLRKTVKVGDPRAQILAHASTEKIDLIVMGTHGRKGASRLLIGSVAERVVREATCPVLTLH